MIINHFCIDDELAELRYFNPLFHQIYCNIYALKALLLDHHNKRLEVIRTTSNKRQTLNEQVLISVLFY